MIRVLYQQFTEVIHSFIHLILKQQEVGGSVVAHGRFGAVEAGVVLDNQTELARIVGDFAGGCHLQHVENVFGNPKITFVVLEFGIFEFCLVAQEIVFLRLLYLLIQQRGFPGFAFEEVNIALV